MACIFCTKQLTNMHNINVLIGRNLLCDNIVTSVDTSILLLARTIFEDCRTICEHTPLFLLPQVSLRHGEIKPFGFYWITCIFTLQPMRSLETPDISKYGLEMAFEFCIGIRVVEPLTQFPFLILSVQNVSVILRKEFCTNVQTFNLSNTLSSGNTISPQLFTFS